MPTICGTNATLLCASCADADAVARTRAAPPARIDLAIFNMNLSLCDDGRALSLSCIDLERPRVRMSARDQGNHFLRCRHLAPALGNLSPAPEHDHPVGDFKDIHEIVGDEDHRAAAFGSSMMTRRASRLSARHMATACLWPPDRLPTGASGSAIWASSSSRSPA